MQPSEIENLSLGQLVTYMQEMIDTPTTFKTEEDYFKHLANNGQRR